VEDGYTKERGERLVVRSRMILVSLHWYVFGKMVLVQGGRALVQSVAI
jgi:hypothetical protein